MKKLLLAAVVVAVTAPLASAGTVERACLKSDRKSASRALCGCIQNVADQTLTRSDQKLVASFFKDPHRAQEIRQSDSRSHETFWKKYKSFGRTAEVYCRRS